MAARKLQLVATPLSARFAVLAIAALFTVVGCGGGGDDGGSSVTPPPSTVNPAPPPSVTPPPSDTPPPGAVINHVSGSVGDGPIVGARIRVFSRHGVLLQETQSNQSADYQLSIETDHGNYPLRIEADQGIDLVTGAAPDFKMVAPVMRASERTISNLNPFTTFIHRTAEKSVGINDSSLTAARFAMMNRYGFGLDAALVPDPAETEISGDNVAEIVKSSEALGEMVRRTRDALVVSGLNLSGDDIVNTLSADLTDGWIDGEGAPGYHPRIAAVANVASAGVMVQFLANRLHVYGVDSTQAMDLAIRQVRPDAPQSSTTANVAITAGALDRTIVWLEAAALLVDDERIAWTIAVLEDTASGTLAAELAPRLPEGIDGVLNEALSRVVLADESKIAAVNTAARNSRNGGNEPEPTEPPPPVPPPVEPPPAEPPPAEPPPAEPPPVEPPPVEPPPVEPPPVEPPPAEPPPAEPPANTPPTISGTPDTQARVNVAWSFQPTAFDADGDKLTFSVMNKPAWLSFDPDSGRLWGTPTLANVGTHLQVRISVSDGQEGASLPAFDLVVAAPDGTATVSWVAPTEREDGTELTGVAHYTVYYGTSGSNLDQTATVSGTTTSYKVEGLSQGTWYFAVTATCTSGLESSKSTIGSKTIL